MAAGTGFGLLGPLTVRVGGVAVAVPRGKQRALLTALLLGGGAVVSVAGLAEALWPDPPPSWRVSVQNHVQRLRKALDGGASLIVTHPGGYSISVGPGELDVARFEAGLAASRDAARAGAWEACAGAARAALSLWRGEPLADVDCDVLAARELPRLAELRLQAIELRIGADLQLGQAGELVAELRGLAAEHPLREGLWAKLMLALYRAGRQGEALAAWRQARQVLVDELGAEPGRELRELHQRIQAGDPALYLPAAGRSAPRPREVSRARARPYGGDAFWLRPEQQVVEFIDRPELSLLRRWCTGPHQPRLMLVTGAGGVGKTRLALQLAAELGQAGWLCRLIGPGEEASAAAAVREARRGGVLLVVDYAETRPGVADLLQASAADAGAGDASAGDASAGEAGDRLRVLLVARGEGEWWAQLRGSADDRVRALVAEAGRVRVGALTGTGPDGSGIDSAALVRAAIPAFARVIGVDPPDAAPVGLPAATAPVLVLHAAALLTVLEARDRPASGSARVVAGELVLTRLLGRESSFWLASAGRAGTGVSTVDPVSLRQAVAVACLFPATGEEDAVRLLRSVPGLADAPAGTVFSVARWLRQLYPVAEPVPPAGSLRWWGGLQPDLLAERHVLAELADSPAFARQCLRALTATQATRAPAVSALAGRDGL